MAKNKTLNSRFATINGGEFGHFQNHFYFFNYPEFGIIKSIESDAFEKKCHLNVTELSDIKTKVVEFDHFKMKNKF